MRSLDELLDEGSEKAMYFKGKAEACGAHQDYMSQVLEVVYLELAAMKMESVRDMKAMQYYMETVRGDILKLLSGKKEGHE